jgi:hypothetical protein
MTCEDCGRRALNRRRFLIGAGLAAGLAACSGPAPDTRPLALVYRGKASCAGCSETVATLLQNNPATPFRTAFCGPKETVPLTQAALATATVYAQPGGGTLDDGWRQMRAYADVITGFVRNGGHYLGFCLGGYLAGATPGFKLLPGDTAQYVSTPDADTRTTRDTVIEVTWRDQQRHMFFQDGPAFVLNPGAAATVLARYSNGSIAALVTPYGKGQVGVVGPHPEATSSWYSDVRRPNPDGIRPDLGYDLVQSTIRPAPN